MTVQREKAIFLYALDIPAQAEREAYLARECGGDAALRRAVDELLSAHDRTMNVLDDPLRAPDGLREGLNDAVAVLKDVASSGGLLGSMTPAVDRVGESVGHYRLLEKIGEGGFGQVYVAEQQQPVRRRVALKLLKPGMDSHEVIARFEAERQALAMMDHPNIARVFDAGSTAAGQPYFVMELVRGVPITDFCDARKSSLTERLELFVDVCQAVQHAHQKGVIHRDLKPSNVMVTLHDATPVVKVIDFGVAKAIGPPLTGKTIYTRFAAMIGTPMYMSPEQAEMNSLDVDTRSDVFSLGVLLYELLTGATPFDQHRLQTATFDELRRIIREEDPPRPSARISTLAPAGSTQSAQRQPLQPAAAGALRGELDWIVMKALEKDRRRRYETAADLARDVQRYLDHQPVVARPPSRLYRLQKYAQRNKGMFIGTSIVLLTLVAGTAVSTWQAIVATRALGEADRLRQEAVEFADHLKEANVLLDSARANADEQRWHLAWTQYTRATELQPEHYLTWSGRGSLYARLGAWKAAEADFAEALKLGAPANNPAWWGVPHLCLYAGDEQAYQLACTALRTQIASTDDPALTAIAARSLLLRPIARNEARKLVARVDDLLQHPPPRRNSRGPFPGRGGPFRGSPPDRGRPRERPRFEGDFRRPPGMPAELQWYAAGLASYRAGDDAQALQHLNRLLETDSPFPPTRIALPVLAMTYHALGRADDAENALTQAENALDEWTSTFQQGNLTELPMPWFDYLECLLLYREAHELIRQSPAPSDDRLEQLEAHALATLHGE